ncbi:hypothetical protein AAGG74_18010 [Bacillus mexicanus]|uniref:hypothetical protein n=1 Tax=Bacillus mexicanus TaxID=2834415 RepID=UPI003D20468A
MALTNVRELNKKNLFTSEQLLKWKKFEGKYLNVYPRHYDYWKDGIGYVTVYEVRGITDEIKENYQSVKEILRMA